jgi:hypothetical protein
VAGALQGDVAGIADGHLAVAIRFLRLAKLDGADYAPAPFPL